MPMDRAPAQLTGPALRRCGLVIAMALYPSRAKRVTGMAPPFVLRVSVSPCRSDASAKLRVESIHVPLSC